MSFEGKSRDELAREANHVRTKLLRTVEQLDQRRHDVLDLRSQFDRHLKLLAVAGGLLVACTAGTLALVVHRATGAAERRRRNRWTLARQMWHHPERAMRAERRSFFAELGQSVLLSVLSAAVAMPAKRALAVLEERMARHDAPAAAATTPPMR